MMRNMNNLPCMSQQGDFILTKDEDLVPTQNSEVLADSERNAKAAGASGIMDRKEVLGGTRYFGFLVLGVSRKRKLQLCKYISEQGSQPFMLDL